MPRKEWIPKNPYCKGSKLPKEEFESMVLFYFFEVTYCLPRKETYILYPAFVYGGTNGERDAPISCQAFSKYFAKIGQYLWDRFIAGVHPALQEEDVFDELLGLINGKIYKVSKYRGLYQQFDNFAKEKNADNITGSLFFHFLSNRSKAVKGFKKDKFYLEVSRVAFLCSVIKKAEIELKSIYSATRRAKYDSTNNKKLDEICNMATYFLLSLLKEKPM